jgi:hypothetical protein
LRFHERDSTQISSDKLRRIDICWSVAVGLSVVDNVRAADFQTRNLLLALEVGEPYRLARALAMQTGFSGTAGKAAKRQTARLVEAAQMLAQQVGHPHAVGLTTLMTGVAEFYQGRWKNALKLATRAEQVLRDQCTGVTWEIHTAWLYQLVSLFYLGELCELSHRVQSFLKEARERGNVYAATIFRTGLPNAAWLAADDPEEAQRELVEALGQWSRGGFHVQHYLGMLAEGQIHLYRSEGRRAWERINEVWPALKGSLLLRIQNIRIVMLHLRARSAVAAASSFASRDLLIAAARDARRIERERMTWSQPLAWLIRAAVASATGDSSSGVKLLTAAAAGFDEADMALYAAAARTRCGQLLGGDEGVRITSSANQWMTNHGIRNPIRMAAMLAPGFPA